MAFLRATDYDVQLRAEISRIIDNTQQHTKLGAAEKMAIAQIRNYISGRYDCDVIFADVPEEDPDTRDQYIVMLVIDLALYHLWSKEAANNIPKHRELRYKDAIDWLTAVQKGAPTDLPEITDDAGEAVSDIRIWSQNLPENNRY